MEEVGQMTVSVSVVLARKGSAVVTIPPASSVAEAARLLAEHDIGALVVSADGRAVDGVISERDLLRWLSSAGGAGLKTAVEQVMTADVQTCTPATTVNELMATMTNQRIRHIPVVVDGRLAGMMSIGDVVKSRLDDLEVQAGALEQYVTGSGT
jgi:CBS domain-containing protein